MHEKITIRQATEADLPRSSVVEMVCFSDEEAASDAAMETRVKEFPQGYLVAVEDGYAVGHVMSGCTSEPDLADEAFKQLIGHDPDGQNMVVFSLAVLPEYQGRGVGRMLLDGFIERSRELGKGAVLLLCKEELVPFYARFGFTDEGVSASTHGGAVWREMRLSL